MAGLSYFERSRKVCSMLALVLLSCAALAGQARAADVVATYKDENGWKLQVNGEDFYVKGVVWGYSPRGQNYTYNLWGESDDFIRKVLDYEFGLMRAAGVNAIRSFGMIPPEWVTYIYREHGIMTAINPLMGRYGATIGGKWVPFTDYSDELTRTTLKAEVLEVVETYKNVPGVLMFALGNESNYGLSWSSFEIENLPEGEQNTAKARYLYSLFAEVIAAGKKIAPNHPFTIVNGDIQYIDLIAEYLGDMDILGSNAYRGKNFTDLWAEVDKKLDQPVLFFEFGADAFNAREFREDQVSQATYLRDQWREMYNKSYGNGEEGNSIGGFVFEWRDEWWKYLQIERLDIQDTNASWSNDAYRFDWVEGKNNMNEEWWGITALGTPNGDGVYEARPRMAYDVLAEIWAMDPYTYKKAAINQGIDNINMDYLELKGEVRLLKTENEESKKKLSFTGGNLRGELVTRGTEESIRIDGENGIEFSDGQMVFLDFGFKPTDSVEGQMSLNILGNVADKRPLEFTYGDRGLPFTVVEIDEEDEVLRPKIVTDGERAEIYDFNAKYEGEIADVEAFYHTPRFHWGYEGDFFGLVHEATDIYGMDIWNAKAPQGVEIAGKSGWTSGFKVVAGPEIYWGANPKFVFKYDFNIGRVEWTFIHSEDVDRRGEATGATGATERQSRQTTLYAKREFAKGIKLELGGIWSANEKIDEIFTRVDNSGNVFLDQIEDEDTLGFKAKLTFPFPWLGYETYVSGHHAGLVADGGQYHKVYGVIDPSRLPYSGLGNKQEYEFGTIMTFGDFVVFPRLMYRDNLVHANPTIPPSTGPGGILRPGASPRDRDNDPFAVLGNREARSAELFFIWDPTPGTQFYSWDNEWREDARFAFDFGGTYTEFPTPTDAHLFFEPDFNTNLSFGRGLPAEDVWGVSTRMVFNPNPRSRYIFKVVRGFDQSTGNPDGGTRDYWQWHFKAILRGRHTIDGYFMKDAWGPYDFYRQFNDTFPEQVKIDYSMLLGGNYASITDRKAQDEATKIGIRLLYRAFDENSADGRADPDNDFEIMTVFYFTYQF